MILTLIPVALAFFAYMRLIDWWSHQKYPHLVDDVNRRRLFEGGMTVGGLFCFILLWGYLFEWLCRV